MAVCEEYRRRLCDDSGDNGTSTTTSRVSEKVSDSRGRTSVCCRAPPYPRQGRKLSGKLLNETKAAAKQKPWDFENSIEAEDCKIRISSALGASPMSRREMGAPPKFTSLTASMTEGSKRSTRARLRKTAEREVEEEATRLAAEERELQESLEVLRILRGSAEKMRAANAKRLERMKERIAAAENRFRAELSDLILSSSRSQLLPAEKQTLSPMQSDGHHVDYAAAEENGDRRRRQSAISETERRSPSEDDGDRSSSTSSLYEVFPTSASSASSSTPSSSSSSESSMLAAQVVIQQKAVPALRRAKQRFGQGLMGIQKRLSDQASVAMRQHSQRAADSTATLLSRKADETHQRFEEELGGTTSVDHSSSVC